MISGRQKNWRATFQEESSKKRRLDNVITFSKEDVQRIQTLYDDDVVVSAMIANYDGKKI